MSLLSRRGGQACRAGSVTIEAMHRRHLREVLQIEGAAYPKSWSRSVFDSELAQVANGSRQYLVARRGRQVVGYGGIWIVPDPDGAQAHVTNLAVAEAYRRQGVASCLMVALARAAVDAGCAAWTLEVRATSTGAQALYRQFGFVPAGVRKRYYENTEDAIVMWCHDIDQPGYLTRVEQNV